MEQEIQSELLKPVLVKFSKKNTDVADILNEISKDGTKKTDYICKAVRFYYRYGEMNKPSPMAEDLEEKFKELFYKYMGIYQNENTIHSNNIFETCNISKSDLEDD